MTQRKHKSIIVSETTFYGGGEKFVEIFLELMGQEEPLFAITNETLHQRVAEMIGKERVLKMSMTNRINKIKSALRLTFYLLSKNVDHVILNGLPSIAILIASLIAKRKVTIVVHTETWNYSGTKIWRFYRLIIERYCRLVFVAFHLKKNSPAAPATESEVLQNRLTTMAMPTLLQPQPRKDMTRIIFIGRGTPSKGILEYLAAAEKLCNLQFFIAGDVNDALIAEKVSALPNVTALGFDSKISLRLHHYDLAVFPSHSEGFPYALLEAAHAGIPVIASDIDAHEELSEILGPFPLFTTGNTDSLIASIISMKDAASRRDLSQRLFLRSKEHNDLTRYIEEFRKIFI